jgi:hypothetical protein
VGPEGTAALDVLERGLAGADCETVDVVEKTWDRAKAESVALRRRPAERDVRPARMSFG